VIYGQCLYLRTNTSQIHIALDLLLMVMTSLSVIYFAAVSISDIVTVPYFGRLVAHFPPRRRPVFEPASSHVGFVVDKAAMEQVSPSSSVSPANHSTDCSTLIIIWEWYNRPNSGRSTKWTHCLTVVSNARQTMSDELEYVTKSSYYPGIFQKGLGETTNKSDSRYSGRDSNKALLHARLERKRHVSLLGDVYIKASGVNKYLSRCAHFPCCSGVG
jgi:hypothetical protein